MPHIYQQVLRRKRSIHPLISNYNSKKKYEEAYAVLKTYYDNYIKMTKSVISPTGSLQTFSEDFNTYDSDTANSFEKMKLYLDWLLYFVLNELH